MPPAGGAYLQLVIGDEHPKGFAAPPFDVEAGKTYPFELTVDKAK